MPTQSDYERYLEVRLTNSRETKGALLSHQTRAGRKLCGVANSATSRARTPSQYNIQISRYKH
ncbi:hypothetical protein SAMN04488061_0872 [Filomicrobium insigne]|uniref:Uncharacterized protein n=1 Tax=Filomicrobium insigne TaxID=418854 RepID=A0A1H0IJI3_9HYPH|nr:hypothetical protein SAMN04488061_0872 [Filomicrobium insigne]